MSVFNVKDAPQKSVQTVAEFDAFLERLAKENPQRFKLDTESGYFDKFRSTLVDFVPKEEPKVVEKKGTK